MATGNHDSFGFTAFAWRWAAATALVLISFNPSGHSWFHWVYEALSAEGLTAVHYFTGVLLLAAWTVFLVATQRSLGTLGIVILIALVGTGLWLLVDVGVIRIESRQAVTWLVLFALGLVLAVGLSWSHVWRRLSGQLEVDDDDG
ncbi:MAG: DUF6524 family protein [Xanthomonadales bacterium]|jgi:hypothetical protein